MSGKYFVAFAGFTWPEISGSGGLPSHFESTVVLDIVLEDVKANETLDKVLSCVQNYINENHVKGTRTKDVRTISLISKL